MITITALKWAPSFAQGNVRYHRVRWILIEVGWRYRMRLLDTEDQQALIIGKRSRSGKFRSCRRRVSRRYSRPVPFS